MGIELPISIIPTGVDLDKFNRDLNPIDKNILKSKLNLNLNSKILVYVGRIAKEKNLDELLDYFADLILKEKDCFLVLVGDGPHINHLKRKIKHLKMENHVRFVGFIQPQEIYKYYHIADIFVSPSTCETQGITYMEALASSLPLVCREDKSLYGVVKKGYNGFTYTNKKEFIEYIIKIFSDVKFHDELRENALDTSLRFSKEKFGNDVELAYLSVKG